LGIEIVCFEIVFKVVYKKSSLIYNNLTRLYNTFKIKEIMLSKRVLCE